MARPANEEPAVSDPVSLLRQCARPSTVSAAWSIFALLVLGATSPGRAADGPGAGGAYGRVLIVGVSPDDNARCRFEQFLANQIQSDATTAISSCDVVTPLKPLTQAGIEQAVSAQQADAVLATILVSDQQSDVEGGDRDTRGGDYFKAEGTGYAPDFWGLYGVPVVYGQFEDLPPIYTLEGTVEVQTRVYDTRSHAMVRTVKTKAKHLESSDQAAAAITEELGKQLRREGVVR
jgi:hypothetical protein